MVAGCVALSHHFLIANTVIRRHSLIADDAKVDLNLPDRAALSDNSIAAATDAFLGRIGESDRT